jgi:hypothetical protein
VLVSVRTALSRHRAATGFAGGVATCVVLGSGVALAAIPSTATGSITACVSRTSGAVRIVDFQAGKRCTTRETTIAWSKGMRYRGAWSSRATYAPLDVVSFSGASYLARVPSTAKAPTLAAYWGPVALRGLAGAPGPQGVAGPAGAPGLNGTNGLNGIPGVNGIDGVVGPPGLNGAPGAPGLDGAIGPQGPAGQAGANGAAGATGPQGPAGQAGATGATGPQGPAGATGAIGPQGATGATGAAGATGATGATGPQGPAGVLGRVVVTVTADVPAGAHTLLDPQCPSGTVPMAGGAHVGSSFPGWGDATSAYVAESDLDLASTGWASTAVVVSGGSTTHFVAHVICVSASS